MPPKIETRTSGGYRKTPSQRRQQKPNLINERNMSAHTIWTKKKWLPYNRSIPNTGRLSTNLATLDMTLYATEHTTRILVSANTPILLPHNSVLIQKLH